MFKDSYLVLYMLIIDRILFIAKIFIPYAIVINIYDSMKLI